MKLEDWIEAYRCEETQNYIIPDYKMPRIYNLQSQLDEAVEVVSHYAGEPFETNDIYMDIFDLIKVEGSVTEFDEKTFAKRAREFINKLENEK